MHMPFFIEAGDNGAANPFQICRKVMASLLGQRIFPLPFASSAREAQQVHSSLKIRHIKPAVFVINTYLAEPLLDDVEKLMGGCPVLLLRRATHTHNLMRKKDMLTTTLVLKKLNGHQTMLCPYDGQSSTLVAEQVKECLLKFIQDGDFWHFARLSVLSISTLDP